MNVNRIFRHLFFPPWLLRLRLRQDALHRIEQAIADSERSHLGELRLVIEAALPWREALSGISARERAIEMFSRQRVWDTEHNSGVLIYLLLADRDIEIVADRGIHARIGTTGWQSICSSMEAHLRAGAFEAGLTEGIQAVGHILEQHFPSLGHDNPDELANRPVVL